MARTLIKIRRQDDPMDLPYWEIFEVEVEPGMTVSDALEAISRAPVTSEGNPTTPVLWDCSCQSGLCGGCTMVINGRVRQACQVLLEEFDGPVVLQPLTKFPIVRDLKVDRGSMLAALERHSCWTDGAGLGAADGPMSIAKEEEELSVFLDCMMCGACSESCPQVNPRSSFSGAFVFSRVIPLNRSRAGQDGAGQRFAALASKGGVADCAGAENCERACPRGIPLVKAQAMLSWDTALYSARRFFRG